MFAYFAKKKPSVSGCAFLRPSSSKRVLVFARVWFLHNTQSYRLVHK